MSAGREHVGGRPRAPVRDLADVRHLPDDPKYLFRVIETIGSGPDLPMILRGVSLLVTEATQCHACLIWFVQDDRLVLRSASPPYSHLAETVSMRLDEGLAGWVVRTRRSAFIEERALDDPRVKYFPELEEERYQSLVSVPIFARDGEVLGVIALHAEAPHEFGRDDLDLLEHTASLIGGAVENARLYEDATARIALLSELSRLSQAIASTADEEDVVGTVCRGVCDIVHAPRVEIHLTMPDGRLRIAQVQPEPRPGESERSQLVAASAADGHGTAEPLTTKLDERSLVFPLIAADERLGLLAALVSERSPGTDDALAAIAAHTALAITRHRAIARLTEKNLVKDLFRELARPDVSVEAIEGLTRRLGCDLGRTHLVLHIVTWPMDAGNETPRRGRDRRSEATREIESAVVDSFPGTLFDGAARTVRALAPIEDRSVDDAVGVLRQTDWRVVGLGVSVGVSNPCRGYRSFARGFDEAEAAAEVGGVLRGAAGITTFNELGLYRYVLGAEDDERDPMQQRLRRVIDYDRKRGTQLLDTLESYLDHRGSVTATSRDKFIHTNTLRQRLDRIEHLSGIDLERADWLSLAVATKVVKLRRMRASKVEGGRDG